MVKIWQTFLSKYEKKAFAVRQIIKGIYWEKTYRFEDAVGYYSNAVNDYYWTMVTSLTLDENKLDKLIRQTESFFSPLGKQYSFYIFPADRKRGVERWLKQRGFETVFEDSWMFYEGKELTDLDNNRIRVKEVQNKKDNELYIKLYTTAYGSDPSDVYYGFAEGNIYQNIYRRTWKDRSMRKKMHRFVAFYDEIAGSMGAFYFKDKIGYLSEVGTDPRFRNKGLGTAISLACLRAAEKENCSTICLCTENKSPAFYFYQKLGFVPKIVCKGWAKKRKEQGDKTTFPLKTD